MAGYSLSEGLYLDAATVTTALLCVQGDSRHELCDEAAGQVARVMTALRGAGAPFTKPAECKTLSAADMADFHEVSGLPLRPLLFPHCPLPGGG